MTLQSISQSEFCEFLSEWIKDELTISFNDFLSDSMSIFYSGNKVIF